MNRICLVMIAVLSFACGCVSADRSGQTDIPALKDFADSYEPVSTEALPCPWLPVPPPAVRSVLENHRVDDEYCRHVSLVLLKLDRSHIERFSQ